MSYDDTLPTDMDKARALLGDIDEADELRTDDHYEALLTRYDLNSTVAFVAQSLATEYARKPGSVTLPNGLSVSWRDRVAAWQALATQMRAGGVTGGGAFSVQPARNDGYAALEAG